MLLARLASNARAEANAIPPLIARLGADVSEEEVRLLRRCKGSTLSRAWVVVTFVGVWRLLALK